MQSSRRYRLQRKKALMRYWERLRAMRRQSELQTFSSPILALRSRNLGRKFQQEMSWIRTSKKQNTCGQNSQVKLKIAKTIKFSSTRTMSAQVAPKKLLKTIRSKSWEKFIKESLKIIKRSRNSSLPSVNSKHNYSRLLKLQYRLLTKRLNSLRTIPPSLF